MGKAFQEQTKTIKEQGERQIKAIQDKRPIKSIEKFTYDINYSPIVLKEKEIYNKLKKKSLRNINNLDKKVDIDKLAFRYKGNTLDEDFSKFDSALYLISKIKDGEISLNEAKDEQAITIIKYGRKKNFSKKFIKRE